MNFISYEHFPVYAIMCFFLGAFIVAAIGGRDATGKNVTARGIVALIASGLSLTFIIMLIKPVVLDGNIIVYWLGNRSLAGGYAIGIALEVDALSVFFALLTTAAVFVSCIYSQTYMKHDDNIGQYYILFLMLSGGVLGLVLTGDIFNMYIMVEILTFAAVALTCFRKNAYGALEAGFKYLVVGCIGSTCVLCGIIMLYAQAHTLNFAQLSALIPNNMNTATKVAFALLFIGFSTKAFIVPFHPLAADAHGAAPASISVLISGVLTKSGVYGIIRLTYFLFQTMGLSSFQFLLVFVGCVSMFVCVTMALAQHDFKRLLAFHSISQIGYVLTAVGLCTALGFSAGIYHAMNHTLFKGLLFLAAGAVLHETGTTSLDELGGLSKKMPHTTALFLIGAFSISGIPPFNGFASKWMIYNACFEKAGETGSIGYALVTIICLITSVLTLASFVKVSHSVFFGRLPDKLKDVQEVPFGMRLAMGILAALCILTGMFPNFVTRFLTEPAAAAAFNASGYIDAVMGSGYAAEHLVGSSVSAAMTFVEVGCWEPVSWLLILCIGLLAVTIVAVSTKYDYVSEIAEGEAPDSKHDLFFGGEKSEFSQVGGSDLFWGFKHNWRHYFSFMHDLHSGIVNDYALWAVIALALAMLFMLIIL